MNLNASIISLSDDSGTENDVANYDAFDGLCSELAYNSDDDIDEEIQKEFDYLVTIGKVLPAPIVVKVEETLETVSKSIETPAQSIGEQAGEGPSEVGVGPMAGAQVEEPNLNSTLIKVATQHTNSPAKTPGKSSDTSIHQIKAETSKTPNGKSSEASGSSDPVGGHFDMIRKVIFLYQVVHKDI